MTDLVDYLREKLETPAADPVIHVRVGGWCQQCGGTGVRDIVHVNELNRGTVRNLVTDLRQSATIMEPARAADYHGLATHIERVLL